MTSFLFRVLFSLLARLSLPTLHRLGAALGYLSYTFSASYAARTQENLHDSKLVQDGHHFAALLKQSVAEAGKSITELAWIWTRPHAEVCAAVKQVEGWQHLVDAQATGKGGIILTPHWGSFEMIGAYVGQHFPLTNLYRAPKRAWIETLMRNGRQRGQAKLASADVSGVRILLKALKRGEAIGLLPDQVPSNGEGEWVDFFHRPAYTMTLSGRLAEASGAAVVLAYAERLADGAGYILRITPLSLDFTQSVPLQINQALEQVIATAPAQYLWSYNRYKTPSGVANPQPNS
ncbi:MAG: lysophospholipid acyltransferase family protein [Gallionella sp.]